MGWKRPEVPFSPAVPPASLKIFFPTRMGLDSGAHITTRAKSYGDQSEIIPVVRVKSTIRNPACLRAQMDGPFQTRGGGAVTRVRARLAAPVEVRTRISRTETERLAKSSLRRDASRSLPRGGVVGARPAGRGKNLS